MRVLVTGGAGFIGSHLLRLLLTHGEEAWALDNLSTGLRANVPDGVHFVEMDVKDSALSSFIEKQHFDAIVHLAGQTMVNDSMAKPALDAEENIVNTVRLLSAAHNGNVKRVIFSSTAAVYGNVTEADLPVRESKTPRPMSFYGLSKYTVEKYLALCHEIYGLDYVVLRFANVYGERQGDGGEGGVISIFVRAVAEGKPVTIFGDGEQTRDFIYAGDVAAGIYAALKTAQPNAAYNISTETETSLRALLSILGQVAGQKIIPKYAKEREGDIYKSMLCNERARRGLHWQPKISLTEGLRRTYDDLAKRGKKA